VSNVQRSRQACSRFRSAISPACQLVRTISSSCAATAMSAIERSSPHSQLARANRPSSASRCPVKCDHHLRRVTSEPLRLYPTAIATHAHLEQRALVARPPLARRGHRAIERLVVEHAQPQFVPVQRLVGPVLEQMHEVRVERARHERRAGMARVERARDGAAVREPQVTVVEHRQLACGRESPGQYAA
jgi:hypothetical protein